MGADDRHKTGGHVRGSSGEAADDVPGEGAGSPGENRGDEPGEGASFRGSPEEPLP